MSEDPLEERQEQEVEVLKAIYLDDFQDLRDRDVWKVRRPPEFTLRLRPNHDSTGQLPGHCSVLLRVKFGPDYPLKPPDVLEVREPRGLSDDLVRELSSALWSMAAKAVGEVMITELSQHTAAWLCAHDKPTFGSFYEEMEARNRAKTERKEQKLAVEREIHAKIESQELEAIREEVARKTEALQEERIKWKEEEKKRNHLGSSASDDAANPQQTVRGTTFRRQTSSSLSISESSDVGHGATLASVAAEEIWFVFKGERVKVDKLTKIGANVLGGSVSVGLLSSTSKLVAISEWSFRTQRVGTKKMPFDEVAHDLASLMKQIGSIEQEMTSIQKVTHPNVIQHIGLAHQKCPAHIKLYVFEDFVCGSNLSFYLSENLPLDLDVLKHYVTGILNALDFMHGHNIVHRDLRDTSVFVDSRGVVRVGDFSIDKRVRDLVQQAREGEERFPVAIGRGGKKVDIYRLGLLALSLAMGEIVQESAIPTKMFPPEYTDFLRKCLNKDERERWNALQLLEHKWLKQGVERSPLRNLGDQKDHLGRSSSPEAEDDGNDEPVAVPFVSVGTGQSRLQNEFSFISKIGKGGFGEVMKVKNNLDGQVYAIKKIKLNSKNKQAMKKLMREVKLLSRLNHENVVRYYTSWIEVTTIKEEKKEVETSFGEDSSASTPRRLLPDMMLSKSLAKNLPKKKSLLDNLHFGVNDLYHEQSDSDFSISFSSHQLQEDRVNPSSSSEDEDDDDDDDVFGTSFLPQSEAWADDDEDENSDIVFENSVNGDDIASSTANNSAIVAFASSAAANIATPKPKVPADQSSEVDDAEQKIEIRFMYIQMEYCDKQTLRNAIDGGLYKDTQRVWRMFREIIEGLVHIHTQAMIHRDLKPVNIFIDSHDHVKIGDFGLATTNVRGGKNMTFDHGNDSVDMESDMTGQIGTALYIAPEINIMRCTIYTQKVDIYSLGIIFFEMCYMPLQTGMERIKILTDLRSEDIRFPADFDESLYMQQRGILNLLLNHDPARRPNSQELLQSDFLPPPQVEEAELREMIRHTLANTKSTAYRHLIDSCLGQNMSPAQDISFDMEVTRDLVRSSSGKRSLTKILLGQEYVRRTVEQVFQRHGAISIQMCNLLPKGKQQIYDKGGVVQVMTRGGGVVMLSFDLRVAFARFLARAQISNIKRYCIAPVFREFQMFGYHPREQIEFAFDIVTPMEGSLLADAEVLYTADEILREFPSYSEVNYFFRLNHTHLLRGILLNSGICENFHQDIYNVIREGAGWSKLQRTTHLVNLGLSEQVVASFLNVLEHEGSPSNINGILRHLTRKKNAASTEIKQALNDLDAIIVKAKAMGTKCAMIVSPSLVYNPGHFSGMVCQLVRKKKRGYEIIAAGGRYDHLLNCFASNINLCNQADTSAAAHKELNQSAVGISLAMDKLHALVAGDLDNQFSAIEVLVYSENHMASMIKEKLELVSRLWSAGVKCVICDIFQTLEEVVIYAQEFSASFIVIMRDSESSVRIRCLDNDRFQERRVPMSDVFDFLVRSLKQQASEALEQSASSGTFHRTESNVKQGGSDSRVMNVQVNYNYRFLDKSKFNATTKKRLESTISTKITSLLHLLAQNTVVQVLALPLPRVVVKSMAAMLEFEDESAFRRSTPALLEKHSRYRKDLANICDEIQKLKFDKDYSVILLYSTSMDASSSSSSPPWRPDLHRQMMNVHRKSKSEDLLREYKRLQEKDVFTDAELISGDGRKTCLHSLILAASSEFLKQWMEGTPMVNAQFTIMLPDASSEELEYLVNILYGVDCVVPEEVTSRLNDLIDLLGISIDLPFRTTVRNQAPVSEVLPICCWHCNLTCSNVEELETHIKIHQGEIFKRKHHKCHQCKKILPSMWKLRQHLATHKGEQSQQIVETVQQALPSDQDDHLYAERTVQSATIDQPTQASDHPYASFVASELTQTLTRRTDHLYSARKLSRKEAADLAAKKEQQMQMKKSDHLYSTPSSPSSPTSAAGTGDKRSLRLASKNVKQGKGQTSIPAKGKAKKGHTIQALGHSYAAARPRKVSGRASSGGSGGKRRSTSMFPCDQCDKEFPQPYRLNRHIREVHIKERKYSCRLCDKSFFKLTSMERHELTHSEHDIWKCGLCSKTFRDQSSLHYHTNKNVCLNKRSKQ